MMYVDFETKSYNKIDLGLSKYFEKAEILCMAYAFDDNDVQLWLPDEPFPEDVSEYIQDGGIVSGYNVMFEWHCFKLLDIDVPFNQLKDTMAQVFACNLPHSLGDATKSLGFPQDKQKDARGKELIKTICVPTKVRGKNEWYFPEVSGYMMEELYDYCCQDVVAERALSKALPQLTEYEQKVWVLTQKINQRGVPLDMELVYKAIRLIDENEAILKKESVDLLGFSVTQVGELAKFLDVPDCTAGTLKEYQTDDPKKQRAVELRQELSSTAVKKYQKIPLIMSPDNTLKNTMVYHGAATGRFASRGGFNVQNMARPPLPHPQEELVDAIKTMSRNQLVDKYGSAVKVAASAVRGVIHGDFIDADFSSIESRVASWIVNDYRTLKLFREGLDQYKDMATIMFNKNYEDVTKDERQAAKPVILGCCYSLGANSLVEYAKGYGVELSRPEATKLVNTYRDTYKEIARGWAEHQTAAQRTIALKKPHEVNDKVSYELWNDFLVMNLPSGRKLYFYQPRIIENQIYSGMSYDVTAMGINTYTRKWERNVLRGSSLYQSSVQATARDLLVHSMLNLEDAGYEIVLTVHDEVLSHRGYGNLQDFIDKMLILPEWADGLPMAAEGYEGERYAK